MVGSSSRINDLISYMLLIIIMLSPLPLGSNRPIFWAISAAFVFFIATVFLATMALREIPLRISARKFIVVGVLVGVYLGYMALAPNANALATVRTLSYAVFFFLMVQVSANRYRAKRIATFMLLIAIIYAVVGFAMHYGNLELPTEFGLSAYAGNAHGTFTNRNSYATYLGFGILLGLALLINRMRGFSDGMLALSDEKLVFAGVGMVLMLVTLISTNSRMGVAALGVAAVFFLLVLVMKRARAGLWTTISLTAGMLIIAGVAFSLYGATLLERLGSVERDADVRFALYEQVWEMIRAKPWAGHGADSFEVAFPTYHHLPVSPDLLWSKAHNTYLTNWAESGLVIGSIPVLLGLWVFFRLLYVVYERPSRYIFSLLGASVILQGAIHSTVDFSLEIQANMYMLLAILALGYAEAMQAKKRGSRDV